MRERGAAAERRRRSTSCSSTTRAGPARCWPSTTTSASWSRPCARPTSSKNTMIVFLSDNGWLQGEHRITGDKFLPYEESLRVPLIIRGPGVPEEPDRPRPGLEHRLRSDPARRRRARRPGGRWTASRCCRRSRDPSSAPTARSRSRRWRRCSRATIPVNAWDRPYTGVRTDRYTYVVWTETGEEELYDRAADPYQLDERRRRSRLRDDQGRPGGEAREARRLQGQGLQREAVRRAR